ncbi:hypothetical protein HYALB_00009900 [Hymenoscyphus albidus]|uniref:Uncharacterized protein n=1 Tax=Hymenoscyphus albidus TaxID=595503 RepID=A0A9N9LR14_9HELO|nr:hypothetical protein HYALB_00009900 [Hymenoscyphus albidus]
MSDEAPQDLKVGSETATRGGSGKPRKLNSIPLWYRRLPANDHIKLFLDTPWQDTPLGPLAAWDYVRQLYVTMMLTDSQPSCLYLGPERISIYNAAFAPLCGKAHPSLMGSPFKEAAFSDIRDPIGAVFEEGERTGSAVNVTDIQVFVERAGLLEETYFSGSFNPLRSLDGEIIGFQNSTHEVTRQILGDRRAAMFSRMEAATGARRSWALQDFVIPFLESNKLDVPMALLYEVDEDKTPASTHLLLRGSIGVPPYHRMAAKEVNINGGTGLGHFIRKASDLGTVTTLPVDDQFAGIDWQGFGDPSHHFSVLPLVGGAKLFGYLILGVNPRRPIDSDHQVFMRDIASMITSVAASISNIENAKNETDRLEKRVKDSEKQITFLAENASVGMLHSSIDGLPIWANEQYFKLTGQNNNGKGKFNAKFFDIYVEEDIPKAMESWQKLIRGEPSVSVEMHLKKLFVPPSGNPEPSCILSHSFPYVEEGRVRSVMTVISDISSLKWAERMEARKAAAAAEAKKNQEDFMDMVSHEMRNPLSAIYTSADTITKSLNNVHPKTITRAELFETLRSNVEWAKTIMSAAKLQKCIVDDLLTLSKLQHELISIKPQPMQLPEVVESTVRIFESDTKAHGIELAMIQKPKLSAAQIDWILCDSSRFTQMLVNFMTNSIKFTSKQEQKHITVTYGAVEKNPREAFPSDIHWAPRDNAQPTGSPTGSPTAEYLPPDSEKVYLTLSVKDTGVGMTIVERQKLFNRFAQASARTSIQHGGTGLGLFVAKKMAEKMNGEIGVSSEPGVGSTFAFYVEAARTLPEQSDNAVIEQNFPLAVRTLSGPIDGMFPPEYTNHIHVLFVEDNQLNQKILAKQLTEAGCVVQVANDGSEALNWLLESDLWHENTSGKRVDIILMDWEMPVMDGLTACRHIRAFEKEGKYRRHVEIIVTTANARDDQIATAISSGADDVISKPFLLAALLDKMKTRLANSTASMTEVSRTLSEP